jgi:hypothetical protein
MQPTNLAIFDAADVSRWESGTLAPGPDLCPADDGNLPVEGAHDGGRGVDV